MEDRVIRGSVAGFIAGTVMNILSFILIGLLNFGEDHLFDYSGELLFGQAPVTSAEIAIALFAHLVWAAFLGVFFAYVLLLIGSSYILYKSWLFSVISWFLLYSLGILFEVPLLKTNNAATTASHLITAIVYGLILGATLEKLGNRIRQ